MILRNLKYWLLLVPFMLLESCATNPVTGKKEFMLLSKQQEVAMGEQADPGIISQFGLYDDQQLQNFIDRKGEAMAKISHRPNLDYEFKIVDSPVVNAFALPGGYVYFTRGIMAHFNNEAEFAGVLGHEIGHITARHSAQQYSKSMAAQLGLAVGSVASETFREFSDLAQTGVGLLFLKYGRDDERQSDKLGVQYSTEIGYDAHEMADFFNTLDRKREEAGQEIPNFLSTHPHPQDRYQTVKQLATQWQQKLNVEDPEVNRNSYLRMIDGLVYGEDPKQGYVENEIFYHPVMKFQYPIPDGWNLQNTPQQVQMAPENGDALMILTLSGESSLDASAKAVLNNYNLELVKSERINVNSFPAIAMVADQQQQNQTLRTLIYLIEGDGRIYTFIAVTAINNFNTYQPVFQRTMGDFERLTDPDKINVEPKRIDIKTVARSGTLESALRYYGTDEDDLYELSVLNGMSLTDSVEKGMLIKTIDG